VAIYVLVEAVARIGDPPHVAAGPVVVVAVVGLLANVVAFLLLREGSAESLNVEGAYLEVLSDLVGSVGVIVGAGIMAATGWAWVDPVVGVGIGLFILPRTWRLASQAVRILVQAAPAHTDLDALDAELRALDDVVDVHDLHVWTLTSEMDVASAHLMTRADADAHGVLDRARVLLSERFGIDHATLQVEPDTHVGCNELTW
jgi:cobalt-zinc-cadmium efflux system protein